MANKIYEDVKGWFSTKTGKHIPIADGQSKADAIKDYFAKENKKSEEKKSIASKNDEKKDADIDRNAEEARKLNEEKAYQDSLKQGNHVSMTKDQQLMFKGKPIDDFDMSEAKDNNSIGQNMKNGKLTEERLALHQELIEDYFRHHKPYAPGQEKRALFTGGGGASGKGVFSKVDSKKGIDNIARFFSKNSNPIIIDPDSIKKMLCNADGHGNLTAAWTSFYHEESSSLAKQIYSTALKHNFPVMYDGTMTGFDSSLKKINQAKKAGYKVDMRCIFADKDTVVMNALDRYKNTGRLVPLTDMAKAHRNAYNSFTKLAPHTDSFALYDNSGRKLNLVATSKNGSKLKVVNKDDFDRFSKVNKEFTLSTKDMIDFTVKSAQIKAQMEAKEAANNKKNK